MLVVFSSRLREDSSSFVRVSSRLADSAIVSCSHWCEQEIRGFFGLERRFLGGLELRCFFGLEIRARDATFRSS